ncbi:MAG TPA: TRAP transporter substrate-binding protein [Bordetella sp.]
MVTRRKILGMGLAAGAIPWVHTAKASTAQYTFKYAGNVNDRHPLTIGVANAAKMIAERSSGQIRIDLFPNSQLGSDQDMLTQLRVGAIDFFTMSGILLADLIPTAGISGVGFAFTSIDQVWPIMDGDLGNHIRQSIEKAELQALPYIFNGGFRDITTSNRPINTPDDLKNFKIRVPVSPLWTSLFSALGTLPASIGWAEVYTALQTHVVDGQETPLISVEASKLYEVQKYCSLTEHMWDGFWMLVNPGSLASLPPPLRKIVNDSFAEATLQQRKDSTVANDTLQGILEKKGMTFNRPDPEAFQATLRAAGFYKQWQGKFGSQTWTLLEKGLDKRLA